MTGTSPRFWWREPGWRARLLAPAALAYGAAARRRLDHGAREETGLPILCVGNFTVGGAGKTPTALALAAAAREAGRRPGFLSRGHGGAAREPLIVDPSRHGARLVGDEPMLLAASAPTAVARDRRAGAALLRQSGCDFLVMDDGFQSARLRVDLALLVVDAGRGLGNGRVVPAGPLRAPLGDQVRHADALLVIGQGAGADEAGRAAALGARPVHRARLEPRPFEPPRGALLAFAGIADPGKFYRSLESAGLAVARRRDFPDHHRFTGEEIGAILAECERDGLVPAATRKDAVRLLDEGERGRALLERLFVLDVDLVFEPAGTARRLVAETLASFAKRTT